MRFWRSVAEGAEQRRGNVSELFSWLSSHELGREYAAALFDQVQVATAELELEHAAADLNALLATFSFWARISEDQRAGLQAANLEIERRLGRPIRSSVAAALITARGR